MRPAHTETAAVTIRRAAASEFESVLDLLRRSGLPTAGLLEHRDTLLVAWSEGRVVGSAALELYPDGALLRSVAVDPAYRGARLGHRLTEAALALAAECGAPSVFLLTETAHEFFPRFGFETVTRRIA